MEKEFILTSTINIVAKNREELVERVLTELKTATGLAWDLLDNAEIDEE